MLQQTRTETVGPYYHAFLTAFPTVQALSDASEQALFKQWEGLGYYSRARNLQKAARVICRELGGAFPNTVEGLRALPGIGPYTAGAVSSIAFHLPEPAVDGNQARALARLFEIDSPLGKPETVRALDAAARLLLDESRPGDFNQALMGLGAMICKPVPHCDACPARAYCAAHGSGRERELPVKMPKAAKKTLPVAVALVYREGRILVRQRPNRGLLASLWEFPTFPEARTEAEAREALWEIGLVAAPGKAGTRGEHVFTHLIWKMTGYRFDKTDGTPEAGVFADAKTLSALPMPTALKIYREEVLKTLR